MPFYDSEAIEQARRVDLLTYLQTCEPQELVHVSGNVYCTKTHDSLRISNGKWCWFSRGTGGYSALDYLIKVNGYSFLEAMETISGMTAIPPPSFVPAPKEEKPKHLLLPQAAPDNRAMMAYLKGRGIDQEPGYGHLQREAADDGLLSGRSHLHSIYGMWVSKRGNTSLKHQ